MCWTNFQMSIEHLNSFFWELSVSLASFFIALLDFSHLLSFFYVIDIDSPHPLSLTHTEIAIVFSRSLGHLFTQLTVLTLLCRGFLISCNLTCRFLEQRAGGGLFPVLVQTCSESLCLYLSLEMVFLFVSTGFEVAHFTLMSLANLELIFVNSERYGSIFIFILSFGYIF